MSDNSEQLISLEDDELIKLCQQQLPHQFHAYKEFLRRHESVVFSTCLSMLGNAQDAEEVCQDALLQVFHKIHQFEGRSSFKTWFYRIVYNMCLNRRKSIAARRRREQKAGENFAFDAEIKQSQFFAPEADGRVGIAFGRLSPEERNIIRLRFVSELSLNEIAETQGLGLSAAKMRLYRAMEAFKSIYRNLPADAP